MNSKNFWDPQTKLSFLIMLLTAYIFSPAAFWFYLSYQLESGAFPAQADSIGIPMAGFLFLWFVGWGLIIFGFFSVAIYRRAFGTNDLE